MILGKSIRRYFFLMASGMLFFDATAKADVYSFTDQAGVLHLSDSPQDMRYKLVLSEGEGRVEVVEVQFAAGINAAGDLHSLIDRASFANKLDSALIRAVIRVESDFHVRAVSRKGAQGLMQLMPDTARRYGVKDVFDPEQNINAGARHLAGLLARFDRDLNLALAAYNAGEQAVLRFGRRVPPYPETKDYVLKVMRLYRHDQVRN